METTQPPSPPPSSTAWHRKSWLALGLEALLISAGVFLGLMGEQWRESAERRDVARHALERFRTEIVTNRGAVTAVRDYHMEMRDRIQTYFATDETARDTVRVRLQGLQPAVFQQSAWDVALATRALEDIDADLAFGLSRIYTTQEVYIGLTSAVGQALFLLPWDEGSAPILRAVSIYYGDIVLMEPGLLAKYDSILPEIDRALQ